MRTSRVRFLGLVWRGEKIDHPNGKHDDFANGAAGALHLANKNRVFNPLAIPIGVGRGIGWDIQHMYNRSMLSRFGPFHR
jgi:hypothetical protein